MKVPFYRGPSLKIDEVKATEFWHDGDASFYIPRGAYILRLIRLDHGTVLQ